MIDCWVSVRGANTFSSPSPLYSQGAGYIEFATAAEADAAMKLDGKELLGRNIRLDWTN